MKVRLYRGPFDGKVMEHTAAGANEIRIVGPKRMSRKQRYEWEREQYMNRPYDYFVLDKSGRVTPSQRNGFPHVVVNYKICIGPGHVPMRHPDGSIFYEWDQPRGSSKV